MSGTSLTNLPRPVGRDFCLVQLTEAGASAAGGHALRYSNGRTEYIFPPGKTVKVARYEWDLAFNGHTTPNGAPMFEIYAGPTQSGPMQGDSEDVQEIQQEQTTAEEK